MIYVDTNILLDLTYPGDRWHDWSSRMLREKVLSERLVTGPVVLAEISVRYRSLDQAHAYLRKLQITVEPMSDTAAFRAGQAFGAYRRAGGPRHAILADFLIGGHAVDLGATLITRDRQRFAAYFPDLTLITPETDHG